jgi:hypothetical protein
MEELDLVPNPGTFVSRTAEEPPMGTTNASSPDSHRIVESTRGLISYLRDLVSAGSKPVLDCSAYERVWWLQDTVGSSRSGQRPGAAVVELDFEPPTAPPALPEVLEGRVDGTSVIRRSHRAFTR